jgi:hypothetical protein
MRHSLIDPRFPDIVGQWTATESDPLGPQFEPEDDDEFVEIFLAEIARREIDATRAW